MAAKKKEVALQAACREAISHLPVALTCSSCQPVLKHQCTANFHLSESKMNINSQELWEEMLCLKGLIVVDAFQAWCGPCKTVVGLFRKIRNEVGSDLLHFAVAEVDSIDALATYRGRSEPVFLFYAGGELVATIRGLNAPLLQKTILEQLAVERKIIEHGGQRVAGYQSLNP